MNPPIIGVTTWPEAPTGKAPRFAGSRAYFEAIEAADGVPFGLPPMGEETVRALYDLADGILLTGGGDIDPALYGEEPVPQLGEVSEERDGAELALASWALEDDKPVLAICRGHQVLNVAYGGTLYQDLPTQYETHLNHEESADRGIRGLAAHDLAVQPGTRLAEAIGPGSHAANTHHHQAVRDLGRGLRITGHSEDGVVEGIEAAEATWIVGVQCHPEEMWREHEWAASLFRAFVREVRSSARRETRTLQQSAS